MNEQLKNTAWTETIEPKNSLLSLHLAEAWRYRDLMWLFIRRDFVAVYKQTILGPLWYFMQPLFTMLMFSFIFKRLAGISTDGVPGPLFYLIGITCWNYFSTCLTSTATTFRDNQMLFGKVYFPRIITPLSIVCSNLIRFTIQFIMFLAFYFYYLFYLKNTTFEPNAYILLLPLLIAILAFLALGAGMLISSLTTKYRDLFFLLQFGVQLLMYATPVIYPLSIAQGNFRTVLLLNPLTSVIEAARYGFLGCGSISLKGLLYSVAFTLILLLIGTVIFNRTEKNFMDTV
jgi:lipopolysaccharide transport system permease protein